MGDEAAVTSKIDSTLEARNSMMSYRTDIEKEMEKQVIDGVDYISDLPNYEKLISNYERLIENVGKKIHIIDNSSNSNKNHREIRDYVADLISGDSKKKIIKNALAIACDKLNCQVAAVFLFSSKDGILERAGIQGKNRNGEFINDDWFSQEKYQIGESFTGKAAMPQVNSKYGKTQVCYDFSSEDLKNKDKYLDELGGLNVGIAMPLNGRNKTYGVLRIINKIDNKNFISDDKFSESDIDFIAFLAGAMAAAISNFHRDAENNILRYLKDSLIESDLSNFDYSSFYREILDFLTGSETAFKAAILRVKNNESGDMDVRMSSYTIGVTNKENNRPRRSDQGFVGLVTESRKPKIIKEISKSGTIEKFISSEWMRENKFESFGCFPLIVSQNKNVVGTLSLFAGREYEFHSGSIDFLNNVISSISILMEKEKKIEENKKKFLALVQQWQNETGFMSSTNETVLHPAYQYIIGMGDKVIPLLLNELNRSSGRWFWALKSITGEDPVPEEQRGKTQLMIEAWINWGKEKGYITEVELTEK